MAQTSDRQQDAPEDSADRSISQDQLLEALLLHAAWLESGGREGVRLDLAGKDLRGLWFSDASLRDAALRDAELIGADFSETRDLQWSQLAGCDLSRVKLPESLSATDPTNLVKERTASFAKPAYLMLTLVMFSLVVALTVSDAAILSGQQGTFLPNNPKVSIPYWFFIIFIPFLLFIVYLFLQIYLQRLWELTARMPAVFPDGDSLDHKINPWFLTCLPLAYFKRLSHRHRGVHRVQFFLFAAFCWWATPLTVAVFWIRYAVFHEIGKTVWHVILLIVTLVLARFFQKTAKRIFEHQASRSALFSRWETSVFVVTTCWCLLISWGVLRGETRANLPESISDPANLRQRGVFDPRLWAPALLHALGYRSYINVSDAVLSSKQSPTLLLERDFRNIDGFKARFNEAELHGSDFSRGWLTGADFRCAKLGRVLFVDAYLQDADFRGADLSEADFSGATLKNAKFKGANLYQANFKNAKLYEPESESDQSDDVDCLQAKDPSTEDRK